MPVYFFDVRTPWDVEPDEIGLELDSAEDAYIEASAAIPGLAVELVRNHDHSKDFAFLVLDEAGRVLWEIPFCEILDRERQPHWSGRGVR